MSAGAPNPGTARLVVRPDLAAELHQLGDFDAEACMNCGVCTATCPLGIDVLPRRVLRDAVLGLDDRVRAAGEVDHPGFVGGSATWRGWSHVKPPVYGRDA